jgi:hypothetical protein
MSKPLKLKLLAFGTLVLFAIAAGVLLSRVDTKSAFESAASEATGLQVHVNGAAAIRFFPTLHVALKDVTVRNQEMQVASIGEAGIGVQFLPLLRKQVRIKRLALGDVDINLEKDNDGHLNFKAASAPAKEMAEVGPLQIVLTRTTLRYGNRQSGKEFKATDCKISSDDVRVAAGSSADIIRNLSFTGRVACSAMRNNEFSGTEVRFPVTGQKGVFKLSDVTMQALGGKGSGDVAADFTGKLPMYHVHYTVSQLHMDELFRSVAPKSTGQGLLDFTADLSMQGIDAGDLTSSTRGEATLRGHDLQLDVGNLDEKLARYEATQNFNLVDVGAFFVAGPLGTAVTKGYNFASLFEGTQGSTTITTLVSEWKVDKGIAWTQDVAMATAKNRLAMQGGLNFVDHTFDNVTIALLDEKGCAKLEQKIGGQFAKPDVKKLNALASLAGPVSRLVSKTKDLMGGKCDVFYEGSVAPIKTS